ncbi:hypothetical protein ACNFU2_07685 [Chryseobacterium sp. PTM-20240506]|uniref:hypothetical protein n=1 Tax=unclassified Chryseobacterium TaxID=2593645 RepID=UPI0027969959|nr:hypothetical protein [Chryseobacterium sp. CKR4-1]MDQ1806216.1 hypothetical protein [Chryseobacterium sp. CKR4-1]
MSSTKNNTSMIAASPINDSFLQSDCLYIQSAGSLGNDSTAGIHLRWALKGPAAEHLPKGDHFQNAPEGFNKPDDFISIFRAPYYPVVTSLFLKEQPTTVIDNEALWLYGNKEGRKFYVYFRNTSKYQQVRANIDPFSDPAAFFEHYGSNVIEVECKEMLFFASQLYPSSNGSSKTEVLSVETNKLNLPKNVTFRKNIVDFSEKIFAENGRSIRFVPANCIIERIDFEFYDQVSLRTKWEEIGKYSLSLDDSEVIDRRLEPDPGNRPVHATWSRYNDGEYVNIRNYHEKWSNLPDPRNTIKDSVKQYLQLSDDPANPQALESYYLNDDSSDPNTPLEVSHLAILQMASLDYHVARMLGLGCLDLNDQVYKGEKFIYAAQYTTIADLKDGQGIKEVHHAYITLPTSIEDERPSLPVDLKEPVPGIFSADPTVGGSASGIIDAEGYTHDGTGRYISLLAEELNPDEPEDSPFYFSNAEFDMSKFTYPVYVGIEYRDIGESQWRVPELPHDPGFVNVDNNGNDSKNETVAIGIPDFGVPAYLHKETKSGKHVYGSYGVNWFSRSQVSSITWEIESDIKPANTLLPPSSVNAFLIQKEQPLLLTSQNEQELLAQITGNDKTLVRLTFEYDAAQDMVSYQKAINGEQLVDFNPLPDNEELFADEIEVFFRPEMPKQVFGMIDAISDLSGNPLVSVIQSKDLPLTSANQSLSPTIPPGQFQNYIGGVFKVGNDEYFIHDIVSGSNPTYPVFHILKKQVGNAFGQSTTAPFDPLNFVTPSVDEAFMIVENMQNTSTWGSVNPHQVKVKIGNNWPIYTEEINITSGQAPDITENTYFRKFRGINRNASVKQYTDQFTPVFSGVYEITFPGFTLNNHLQYSNVPGADSIQWYRGSVRIARDNDPGGERKTLKVLRIDNIGTGELKVYAQDETFATDPLQASVSRTVDVNFYPGYRAYLYYNAPCRLTEGHLLPQDADTLEKYSIFGLRSSDLQYAYQSRISTPSLLFGRKIEAPMVPQLPLGAQYATRPDYFGRSSYAFTTEYAHRPFSVTFLRSNDDILLTSLYKNTEDYGVVPELNSVEDIRMKNGDEFFNSRLSDLANSTIDLGTGQFKTYNGYGLPIPNNPRLFDGINEFISQHNQHYQENLPDVSSSQVNSMNHIIIPADPNGRYGQLKFYDFVKQTIQNTYVPLTEIPVIYQHIKGGSYQPIPKAQVIRDRNGTLLNPTSPEFDMAPMMKVLSTTPSHKTLFVDYTLDGASTSVYFYSVRETNAQMVQSEPSPAIGPIKMVNSFPLRTPEIKSVIPVLENTILSSSAKMQVNINPYDKIHNVKKAKLYRALNMADATSIRTMTLVKELDLEAEGVLNSEIWTMEDDFSDLPEVPFGDPLYYKVTVEAEVEYANANYDGSADVIVTEYAPSEASKLMITIITENILPSSPELKFESDAITGNEVTSAILNWKEQCYKGKYHLYKLNNQGNWKEIARMNILADNVSKVQLYLFENDPVTNIPMWMPKEVFDVNDHTLFLRLEKLGLDPLSIADPDGNPIYHHFKMITENTAGMLSKEDKVLTVYDAGSWTDIGGISSDGTDGMIIEQTFIVSPN